MNIHSQAVEDALKIVGILTFVAVAGIYFYVLLDGPNEWDYHPTSDRLRVTRVGACDYIEVGYQGSQSYRILHRADCPNPAHIRP